MRMVSMLAGVLARIVFLKNTKDFPLALEEIRIACSTLLGMDGTLIRECSPGQLRGLLGTDPSLAVPRTYILGLLLKEESEIRAAAGEDGEAVLLALKSLELLLDAWLEDGKALAPDHAPAIGSILERLSGFALTGELLSKIMTWYELTGRFDRAEDVLFDIVALTPAFASEGMQFYRRLLLKSDEDLQAGNLPRDEILEGIADLKTR